MPGATAVRQVAHRCKIWIHPRFFWTSDFKNHGKVDQWDDLYEAFMAPGGAVEGDCDDYALTAMTWIEKQGGSQDAIDGCRALLCLTEEGEVHMVCGIDDHEAGVTWILDCRFGHVLPSADLRYTWKASCRRGMWSEL